MKMKKVFIWQVVSAVLLITIIAMYFFGNLNISGNAAAVPNAVPKEQAKEEILSFLNNVLLKQSGQKAELNSIQEEQLYKMQISVGENELTSYATKDMKFFYGQGMNIEDIKKQVENSGANNPPQPVDVPKSDKPKVEVFVMSHCPYGTQIEKGILPVWKTLGDKADIEIKFVSYAMHGKTELDEQLNQYCIQKNEPDKFIPYIECFLKEGKGTECIDQIGIDKTSLESCVQETDKEYKVTEMFEDKNTWLNGRFPVFNIHKEENDAYGVRGSPGLVINGQSVSAGRDSVSLLSAVCDAFNEKPEECETDLSSEGTPSPGFGYEPGTATTASCG